MGDFAPQKAPPPSPVVHPGPSRERGEQVRADSYEYRVEEDPFEVEDWMRHCEEVAGEADEHRRRREAASEQTPVP